MTEFGSGFLALLAPCPLDACDHSLAMHNPGQGTAPPRCRAMGCQCKPEDLANEEWS